MLPSKGIDKIVDTIKEQAKPDKIYLFGSYAYGKATEEARFLARDHQQREEIIRAKLISKNGFIHQAVEKMLKALLIKGEKTFDPPLFRQLVGTKS